MEETSALLNEVHTKAHELGEQVALLQGTVGSSVRAMAVSTQQHVALYTEQTRTVDQTTRTAVRAASALIAQVEALNDEMKPVKALAEQVLALRRELAALESRVDELVAEKAEKSKK